MKLSDIPPLTRSLFLRGQPVTVRALSMEEFSALDRQAPIFEPVLPDNATAAEIEVERRHPANAEKRQRSNEVRAALQAAAYTGLEGDDGAWRPSMLVHEAAKLADQVMRTLSSQEIMEIIHTATQMTADGFLDPARVIGTETTAGN